MHVMHVLEVEGLGVSMDRWPQLLRGKCSDKCTARWGAYIHMLPGKLIRLDQTSF